MYRATVTRTTTEVAHLDVEARNEVEASKLAQGMEVPARCWEQINQEAVVDVEAKAA